MSPMEPSGTHKNRCTAIFINWWQAAYPWSFRPCPTAVSEGTLGSPFSRSCRTGNSGQSESLSCLHPWFGGQGTWKQRQQEHTYTNKSATEYQNKHTTNIQTNTSSISGVQKGRWVSKWLQSESTAMCNNSRGEVQFKETTLWIKNDQTILKVQEIVRIFPRCTNYSKWSCIGNSCSWTIFKLFIKTSDTIYLPEYKSTWVDHWSTRTQCEAPKDVVSCSSCECKPVRYFLSFLFFYPSQLFNCMPISFVKKFSARIFYDQHVTYTKDRQLKVSYCVFCPSSSSSSSSASSVSSASSSASSTPGCLLRLLKSSSAEESHKHQLGCLLRFLNHHHQPSK